jgi:two-component system phosphate regulon sensor histidine kinase PhoR
VDKSHSRQTGGTGLGLSIVKHVAEVHQAQIRLTSTPGQGTAVSIRF